MANVLRVAGIQMYSETGQVDENKKKAIELVEEAAKNGAKMICLPELWVTGYHLQKKELPTLAEFVDGATITTFRKLAKQLGVVLVVPFLEREMRKDYQHFFISAAIIDCDGSLLGIHRKSMLWGEEKNKFTAGEKEYHVYNTSFGAIGILICYDIEFPEPTRILALKGAELIFVPSVWSFEAEQRWDIQLPARALDNTLFVFGVNTCGNDSCGKTKIVDPTGSVIQEASRNGEKILYQDVDFNSIQTTRRKIPYLTDFPSQFTPGASF